jgi:hypothetical protein
MSILLRIEKIKNGFIKTITDDNFNGVGIPLEETEVFELKRTKQDSVRLLTSIAIDLGLNLKDVIIGYLPDKEENLTSAILDSDEIKKSKSTKVKMVKIKKSDVE